MVFAMSQPNMLFDLLFYIISFVFAFASPHQCIMQPLVYKWKSEHAFYISR